jgi:signal peptidase I
MAYPKLSIKLAAGILFLMFLVYSVIEPYKIPSGSMVPTLKIGDHIFVNKLAYGLRLPFVGEVWRWGDPKRAEVFVFVPPTDRDVVFVKRVIGVPGDTIRVEDDKLYINGQFIDKVAEPFYPAMDDTEDEYADNNHELFIEDLPGTKHYVLFFKERYLQTFSRSMEIKVPENSYFAMGDNRDHSQDSRFWGFVKRDDVRGRAMFVWLSINISKMFTPSWIRFSRIGKPVH